MVSHGKLRECDQKETKQETLLSRWIILTRTSTLEKVTHVIYQPASFQSFFLQDTSTASQTPDSCVYFTTTKKVNLLDGLLLFFIFRWMHKENDDGNALYRINFFSWNNNIPTRNYKLECNETHQFTVSIKYQTQKKST